MIPEDAYEQIAAVLEREAERLEAAEREQPAHEATA